MSEENGKKFTHVAFSVRDREGKESRWTEIGVVIPHKDGKGFDLLCDAVPLNGRITCREPKVKEESK